METWIRLASEFSFAWMLREQSLGVSQVGFSGSEDADMSDVMV